MPVSEFHLQMCLLLELTQTGTVAEYTAMFWEHLHRVLHLDSTLSIKCFVPQYIEGLREDIQAAVQSQSPSSITRASSLARIREEEIRNDAARAVEELHDYVDHGVQGLAPKETLIGVSPELAAPVVRGADHGVVAIDTSSLAVPTLTTCSTECPSCDATINFFPELAASAVCDEAIDIDTVSVMAPTPATCSTGLIHGDVNCPVAVQMLRPSPWPSFVTEHTSTARSSIVEPPVSAATASWRDVFPNYGEITLDTTESMVLRVMNLLQHGNHLNSGHRPHCLFCEIIMDVGSNRKDGVVCLRLNSDQEGQLLATGTIVVQPKRLCSVEIANSSSSGNTLHGTHIQLTRAVLVDFARKISPTTLSTTPERMQVTGDPHMCSKSQHCMASESARNIFSTKLEIWLLLMGNTLSYLRVLRVLGYQWTLPAVRATCCEIEELSLVKIQHITVIIVEFEPWPSWEIINGCCKGMPFCWWFLPNAFLAIFSATTPNVLHLMAWCSAIQYVQPTNAIGDATLQLWSVENWDTRMPKYVPVICLCGLHPLSIQPEALITHHVIQWDFGIFSITVQGQLEIPFVVHVHDHVVIGKMPEQNLAILWPPWRRNAFSPGHSAIYNDQLLLANIQSQRRSGFSLGKYGIGGAQHVVDKLPSWRRNAFSPRNSVMQGSPEMWFSFFSQFHMTHFSASKWDPGNRLQFLLLITIYHFLRLEDLACWSAQFSTSWSHMWAWLYRLFSAPDQHTCFSSSPVYMVHAGSSCMCAGAKEQWKALYCVQNWCLCRMECSQQHILDWKICNPCPTGFYTRTQFQWTLRDMLPFGKPAMEVNYACVSTIPEWFTCSVGLLDSKLPVFSFLWVMHCTQLHNFSIASLCSQSWYSCCYKKIQIAVIATVCLVLECPKLIAAACYMKVLSWTWTRCEHNLRHLIRNGVEGIDHVGHERQRTHLTGQWDSFLVVVHWNHQEDGSECYFHLQSRLLGLIVQQLCNMSSLEGMPWDPGGIHGSGI